MDAKVLKAAVSAAIRVTVSTTLIGCGGSVTSNADGPVGAEGGKPGQTPSTSSAPKGTGDKVVTGYPKSEPVTGGKAGGGAATGGVATAGAFSSGGTPGGAANAAEAGSAGESNGGTPQDTCAELDTCFALLEAAAAPAVFGAPVSAANQPCCQTVLDKLGNWESSNVCLSELNERFMHSRARSVCCSQENWSYPACAPWGPPVPPELSLATLLEWEAAA